MPARALFESPKPVIGVIHLQSLPTSPRWRNSLQAVLERAEQEATALASGGVDGILVENFFDAPFCKGQVDPAVVSAMTLAVQRIKQLVDIPIGVNVLRNDGKSAMAIASCTGAQFIRVNVLAGGMVTDQGVIEGIAYELLRYRRELGSEVQIFADVLVKHSQPLGGIAGTNLAHLVQDTIERSLADGVIISGSVTGEEPSLNELKTAAIACHQSDTPLWVGSGATAENVAQLLTYADGVIVASSLKKHGQIQHPIDPLRVQRFMEAVRGSF
ncbi:MAG: photosystem I biogenesis protein BtpA [Pseudanabaenaceae cyanobacterium]